MGRGNYGSGPKPRSSLAWFFLVLLPVAIVLIHFDVLSFGAKPAATNEKLFGQTAHDTDKPVSAPQAPPPKAQVPDIKPPPVASEPELRNEVNSADSGSLDGGAVGKSQRRVFVGKDVATATHTCDGDQHAIDDDGNSCMPDLNYRLSRSVIFAVERPDVQYMVCAIPKNGCTYHLALINRIYGESNYESTSVVHDVERKIGYKLSSRGVEKMARLLANDTIPKYIVVRNPLQRTMSAYLNKVENFMPQEERTVQSFHKWVYREFPKNLPIDRSWDGMNPHWIPQMQFCGFKVRDVHSYFNVFRVEEPAEYVEFIYKHVPEKYLKDGWAKEENLSFRDHVLGPRTRTEGTSEKFLKYFNNLEVFDHMSRVLSQDIKAFGYEEDVQRLRDGVKERIELLEREGKEDEDLD